MVPASSRLQRLVLVAILCLAAWLRFAGIDHNVRRGSPAMDEQNNVVLPVLDMWSKPTANPGVRIGYAGFFNYLAFLPVGLGQRWAGETGAYVAGRGLVACFGVLSVFLLYGVARELAGGWPALFAASLLAVSRGEVGQSHYITPDVAVVSGTLAVLLLAARRPLSVARAAAAGAVCGLTVAMKYTGLLAVPGLVVALVLERVPRKAALAALLTAAGAFAAAAPYAILRVSSPVVGTGLGSALRDYYSARGYAATAATAPAYANPVAVEIVGYLSQNLGYAGLLLAALAPILFRPPAGLIPALTVAVLSVVVMLPARLVYPRHLLVPSAALALLAACGLHGLRQRVGREALRRGVAVAVAVLVLVAPARSALSLALRYRRPAPVDLAAAWIEGNIKSHALVATGLPRFVLARDRFEVRSWAPLRGCPPRVLRHYDLVVGARDELSELPARLLGEFDDGSGALAVASPERPPLKPIAPVTAAASHDADQAAGPWTRRASWRSPVGSSWIAAEWAAPEMIERVELVSDAAGGLRPHWLEIEGRTGPEAPWRKLDVWPLRPGRLSRQSTDAPPGQIYVMVPPVPLAGLRISCQGSGAWGLARIDVLAALDAAPPSAAAGRADR